MQANTYTIDFDTKDNIIRYRIEGFWEVATVDAFVDALSREAVLRSARGRKPALLGDASVFPVQSAPVAQAFEARMFSDVLPRVDRLALIVAAMLNKLQVERGIGDSRTAVFLNEADALAWLRSPE